MNLKKVGTFHYGDDPYALIGKYVNSSKVYKVSCTKTWVHLFDMWGNLILTVEADDSIRGVEVFEKDPRRYIQVPLDVNADLVGKMVDSDMGTVTGPHKVTSFVYPVDDEDAVRLFLGDCGNFTHVSPDNPSKWYFVE